MSIIPAASAAQADVDAAIALAGPGDTVTIPVGTAHWTAGISRTLPANVSIVGAGTTATGGGDQTVIIDDYASGAPLLSLGVAATGNARLSGITFQSGTGLTKDGGTVRISGPGLIRIDHCRFNATALANYKILYIAAGVFGVADQCDFNLYSTNAVYFYNGRDSGETQGNLEWTLATAFGGADYFYVEDSTINGDASTKFTRFMDCNNAARVVLRFNSLVNACLAEDHGTGHSNDDRGPRSREFYGNAATSTIVGTEPNNVGVDIQGGTALVWGNSWNQVYKTVYRFQLIRKDNGTYSQSPTPTGWGYAGTAFNGTGSNWDGGTFNATSTVDGYPCIDQPGRGAGDLLTGSFPSKVNDTTGTIRWPNQALEPILIWNNVGTNVSGWGGAQLANVAGSRMVANRDYYYDVEAGIQTTPSSPFNGTTGAGWGTIANRPTTCTTGVVYFATDQGSWNQSATNPYGVQRSGVSGVLYIATATNTWSLYYTPYTYPHPLRGGVVQVATPTFTPSANTFSVTQHVVITCATIGATIRYTVDGTTPTTSHGTIYSSSVTIAATTTLKAIAYNGVDTDSSVLSGTFTIAPILTARDLSCITLIVTGA